MFCGNCGNEIKNGDKYCSKCGAKTNMKYRLALNKTPTIITTLCVSIFCIVVIIIIAIVSGGGSVFHKDSNNSIIEKDKNSENSSMTYEEESETIFTKWLSFEGKYIDYITDDFFEWEPIAHSNADDSYKYRWFDKEMDEFPGMTLRMISYVNRDGYQNDIIHEIIWFYEGEESPEIFISKLEKIYGDYDVLFDGKDGPQTYQWNNVENGKYSLIVDCSTEYIIHFAEPQITSSENDIFKPLEAFNKAFQKRDLEEITEVYDNDIYFSSYSDFKNSLDEIEENLKAYTDFSMQIKLVDYKRISNKSLLFASNMSQLNCEGYYLTLENINESELCVANVILTGIKNGMTETDESRMLFVCINGSWKIVF